jgi:transcriptional repressor NrdR
MKCPFCSCLEDKVLESRQSREGDSIRRRRECEHCHRRFTTYERVEPVPLMVVKRDGRREPFDRDKILRGLVKACQKLPISPGQLEAIADEVEGLLVQHPDREIPTAEVGELIMDRLYEIDEVAYVRFASVYRSFKDVRHFLIEIQKILDARDRD